MTEEIIKIKTSSGHTIFVRKGHFPEAKSDGKPKSFLFPFPKRGYKYFGIFEKPKTK